MELFIVLVIIFICITIIMLIDGMDDDEGDYQYNY